jgi:hypothetical protein
MAASLSLGADGRGGGGGGSGGSGAIAAPSKDYNTKPFL